MPPMDQRNGVAGGVLVLHKTLDILEMLRSGAPGVALADIARALEMPKPTVYRIVSTLESRGYVSRNQAGRYQITRKLFDLESKVPEEEIIARAAYPIMVQLVDSCKETVNLGILDAGEVVVINTIESPLAIRMSSKIGNRRHLHATALGKVMMAGLSEKDVLRLIRVKKLPRLTPRTIVTRQELLAELELVRRQGFAMDNEENEPGGRCIGAPIVGAGGRVVSALSISAPIFRMDETRAESLVQPLIEACGAISRAISQHP